jgi:hypothetical protein
MTKDELLAPDVELFDAMICSMPSSAKDLKNCPRLKAIEPRVPNMHDSEEKAGRLVATSYPTTRSANAALQSRPVDHRGRSRKRQVGGISR